MYRSCVWSWSGRRVWSWSGALLAGTCVWSWPSLSVSFVVSCRSVSSCAVPRRLVSCRFLPGRGNFSRAVPFAFCRCMSLLPRPNQPKPKITLLCRLRAVVPRLRSRAQTPNPDRKSPHKPQTTPQTRKHNSPCPNTTLRPQKPTTPLHKPNLSHPQTPNYTPPNPHVPTQNPPRTSPKPVRTFLISKLTSVID